MSNDKTILENTFYLDGLVSNVVRDSITYFSGNFQVFDSAKSMTAKPIGILTYQSWVGDDGFGTGNQVLKLDDGNVFFLATLNTAVNGQIDRALTIAAITAGAGKASDVWYGEATFSNIKNGVLKLNIRYKLMKFQLPTESLHTILTDRKVHVSLKYDSMRVNEQIVRSKQTNQQIAVCLTQTILAPLAATSNSGIFTYFGTSAYVLGLLNHVILYNRHINSMSP